MRTTQYSSSFLPQNRHPKQNYVHSEEREGGHARRIMDQNSWRWRTISSWNAVFVVLVRDGPHCSAPRHRPSIAISRAFVLFYSAAN
ncbi:Uncharacterized protein APZ42_030998 [Daphnia magna]|uniref:Uncharacterized protein n=1 Tax=Daphnia magna TaxID=35525 RepID=A0A164N8Y7_9CRUS|nr:Uncharacterized protein APZ42_030998 [Daphnia magna]